MHQNNHGSTGEPATTSEEKAQTSSSSFQFRIALNLDDNANDNNANAETNENGDTQVPKELSKQLAQLRLSIELTRAAQPLPTFQRNSNWRQPITAIPLPITSSPQHWVKSPSPRGLMMSAWRVRRYCAPAWIHCATCLNSNSFSSRKRISGKRFCRSSIEPTLSGTAPTTR